MLPIQRFAIEKIHCAPLQDRQFNFSLVRITDKRHPAKGIVKIYNIVKRLPQLDSYHVFIIGNLHPTFINLLPQRNEWFRDVWINASEDMNERNYILQVYNDQGVMFPRDFIHYSFIDERSIVVAIRVNTTISRLFDVESFKYLRVYSNKYFSTSHFSALPTKIGIQCSTTFVQSNVDKVRLQDVIANQQLNGGLTTVYVNGLYTDNLNLHIPDNSFVELLYDQSILSKEKFKINSLRTFDSIKDNRLKYFIFRDNLVNKIQYNDDVDVYISTDGELVTRGLYYYKHNDFSMRNVTDKDYSLNADYVNNLSNTLYNLTNNETLDKVIVLYTRRSGLQRELIYSSLKLHELYKLPQQVELDVLLNHNYSMSEFRVETLENSDYFKLASTKELRGITKELSSSVVGYNGVTHYFAYSPIVVGLDKTIDVPLLYQTKSYAYEYNSQGILIDRYITNGPLYTCTNTDTSHVEFIKGNTPDLYTPYLTHNQTFTPRNCEFRLISAHFNGVTRITNWEDITNTTRVVRNTSSITLKEDVNKLTKIVYMDEPLTVDLNLSIVDGVLYFPIPIREDRSTGYVLHSIDTPYKNIEVFLNNYRLAYNVDFFINFPFISITNKTYIDYTKPTQSIHIRAHGFTIDKNDINKEEIRGFVNSNTLTRNKYYDISDDKVFSVFIDGKIYDRRNIRFAEESNTVEIEHNLNGLPYTLSPAFIPVREVTGVDTLELYNKNKQLNSKISQLFNLVFKEPTVNTFNVINKRHTVFSPTVSKIIHDMLDNNIPHSLYTNSYNDADIIKLLDNEYRGIFTIDPIKYDLPINLVDIHPHIGNSTIELNLFQYRFITNVIRVMTKNNSDRINISGYLSVTT